MSYDGTSEPSEYPEDGDYIGIDTCATVSVSGRKCDFPLQIEMGTERVNGIIIEGIGGEKCVNGSGPVATVVQAFNSDGTGRDQVAIYDHGGMYIDGDSARIFNASKLADLGCTLKMNYWGDGCIPQWIPEYDSSLKTRHVLISEQDGTVVPLYLYRSILSARTQNLDVHKLSFSNVNLAVIGNVTQHRGFIRDKCLSESPEPSGSIAVTSDGRNGETEVNLSEDPNIEKDPNFEKDTIFENDPVGKNGQETDANRKKSIVPNVKGQSSAKRARVLMIRANKTEKVDFAGGQNMTENSDKIIFVTAGGNGNGNVRTEIRQETDGAKG